MLDCSRPLTHENLQALLWMQRSGEYLANVSQAFALARLRLIEALEHPETWPDAVLSQSAPVPQRFAIITDIDETLLDNTPAEAQFLALDKRRFDGALWTAWETRAMATPLPGAIDFLQEAARRRVAIFYVTNRENRVAARSNLEAVGFPVSSNDAILVQGQYPTAGAPSGDKSARRAHVAETHRVLLALGDDLGDFASVVGLSADQRLEFVRRNAVRFGREWIALPNPVYGSWDRALYGPSDPDDVILKKKCEALREP
jgi:acid phosphatase